MKITFDENFYKDLGVPQELEDWFNVNSLGVTLSYEKSKSEPSKLPAGN